MPNWKDSIPSNYLKASDFPTPKLFTISKFTEEKIGDDVRPVVWFNEDQHGLVLNQTNGNTIESIAETPETDAWHNVAVVLFAAETDFKGKRVPCIRVRAPKAGAKLPEKVQAPAEDDASLPF